MAKSIIQEDRVCYLSGRTDFLENHHIFSGSNRKYSERYGLKVYLNHWYHNEPPAGVHHNQEAMKSLHRVGQRAFEEKHGTREDFMRIFGRNYLDD